MPRIFQQGWCLKVMCQALLIRLKDAGFIQGVHLPLMCAGVISLKLLLAFASDWF